MARVWVDRNRHTFLEYRDSGKVRHFVTMEGGSIDIVQMTPQQCKGMEPCLSTPEHFAKTYLSSYLTISRSARAVLQGILGDSGDPLPVREGTSFSSSAVSLEQICEGFGWCPSKARKHLRKLVEKPGGRWAWGPEEAEKITLMLKECFADAT